MPLTTLSSTKIRILLLLFLFPVFAFGQDKTAPQSSAQLGSARIAWEGKPKITRYRLQLSNNEQFSDIVFDKVVQGREYRVTEIPPGRYFWRVAPAASETGAYSKPFPVTVSPPGPVEPTEPPKPTLLSPPNDVGWRTATGFIEQPVAAKLRAGSNFDVLGANAYGMVYAISGENGVSLWSARYRPDAKKGEPTNSDGSPPFTPIVFERKDKSVGVLAAFAGGVRGLDGATGRELWRDALSGEAIAGVTLAPDPDGSIAIAVSDNSNTLSFVKGDNGQIISQTKVEGFIVGRPVALSVKNERCVLMALNTGTLDVRNTAGVSLLAIKLDSKITTGPLLVNAPRGHLVMLGTEAGLVALSAADLTPLWRVATEGDAPQGTLSTGDLDWDGTEEVVMITRRGRVVAISVGTGKIKWFTEGAADATKAAFADVNGDGTLDVIVAGGSAFAVGYSGKDGALIWRADELSSARAADNATTPRILVTTSLGGGGSALLVGADPGRTGLRAVGLPADALKTR